MQHVFTSLYPLLMTIAPASTPRKPTGLLRGQAATIARIHRVTLQHVLGVARGQWGGRPALVRTITEYRERNAARSAAAA